MELFEKSGAWEIAQPGVDKRSLTGSHMTYICYRFQPGATFPLHFHVQEQLCILEEGTLQCQVGDENVALTPDRVLIIPQNLPHTMTAGGDGARLSCVLSPPRTPGTNYELLAVEST